MSISIFFYAHVKGMDTVLVVLSVGIGGWLVAGEHWPSGPVHFMTECIVSVVTCQLIQS